MELSDRKKRILRAVIDHYVQSAEPVGSKVISADPDMSFSSATIRNEMAELESMGLLEQPHTSAGRIPTSLGYRVYVNELMERQRLSIEETENINAMMRSRVQQLDDLLGSVGKMTAQLTNYPAYALSASNSTATISRFDFILIDPKTLIVVVMIGNNDARNKLVHLPFPVDKGKIERISAVFNSSFTGITEREITPALIAATERVVDDGQGLVAIIAGYAVELLMLHGTREAFVTGTSNLFEHPEYRDINKAQRLLTYLSDSDTIKRLPAPDDNGDVRITIGTENLAEELKDSSVIVAQYNIGDGMNGLIGVVGPTRMDYSKVAARLSYIANSLSWLFSGTDPIRAIPEKKDEDK